MTNRKHDSDSSEQKEVEKAILDILRIKHHDIKSIPFRPYKEEKLSFQIDGYSESTNSYFEFYAGLDTLKPGQQRKVACDILKLITIEDILKNKPYNKKSIKKYFVVISDRIKKQLSSPSWLSHCIKRFDIEIISLEEEVGEEAIKLIEEAKKRQGDKFKKKDDL